MTTIEAAATATATMIAVVTDVGMTVHHATATATAVIAMAESAAEAATAPTTSVLPVVGHQATVATVATLVRRAMHHQLEATKTAANTTRRRLG